MDDKNITIVEKRIKFLRDLKDLSQEEIAKDLKVSRSTVNSWENGYASISLRQLVRLTYYHQVPIDYILGLTTKFNKEDYHFVPYLDLKFLGKRLKLIRKMQDLKQIQLAEQIKTHSSSISYYESGKMCITTADLKDICNTYGYSADWCIGNINECIRRKPKIKIKESEIRQYIEC